MNTLFVGQNKITLQTIDSTNNYAAKLIKMSYVPDGTVIMAQNQTDGRGQRDNKWVSEVGQNLLCSYILQPKSLTASDSFIISMVTALASYDAIKEITESNQLAIKWPNDILINDKKIAGILIENSIVRGLVNHSIIGIGINSNQSEIDFSHATSIRNETNRLTDTDELLNILSSKLEKWYLKLTNNELSSIMEAYNSFLWRKDQVTPVRYREDQLDVTIKYVSQSGELYFNLGDELMKSDFSDLKIYYEK